MVSPFESSAIMRKVAVSSTQPWVGGWDGGWRSFWVMSAFTKNCATSSSKKKTFRGWGLEQKAPGQFRDFDRAPLRTSGALKFHERRPLLSQRGVSSFFSSCEPSPSGATHSHCNAQFHAKPGQAEPFTSRSRSDWYFSSRGCMGLGRIRPSETEVIPAWN